MIEHAHVLYVSLNPCVKILVMNGQDGIMNDSKKHNCDGCIYFIHENCDFCNRNIDSNTCPCSLCIIKMMCKRACQDWFEWKKQWRWL